MVCLKDLYLALCYLIHFYVIFFCSSMTFLWQTTRTTTPHIVRNSNSKYEKLLGVKVDHELNFNEHVSSFCKKASQKLNALSRIASRMTFDQRRMILNPFMTYFSYCPIVWMFHSRKLNERINHIHERALRIVYKDFNSSFQKLLIKDNSSNIHHRKLQNLQS